MRIERLEEYIVLTETLNYGQAAKRLYVSQSVLSRHISDLEQELGVQLLVRSRQQVEVTPIGKSIAEDAKRVISAHRRMLANIEERKVGVEGSFTTGFLFGVAGEHMASARTKLSEKWPNVRIRFSTFEFTQIIDALASDAIDFAVAAVPTEIDDESYVIRDLFEDPFVLMMEHGHPLASRTSLSPHDLAGQTVAFCPQPFFSECNRRIMAHLQLGDGTITFEDTVHDIHVLPILLQPENSVAVTLGHMSSHFGDRYAYLPIEGLNEKVRFAAIWKKEKTTGYFEDFARLIKREIDSRRAVGR